MTLVTKSIDIKTPVENVFTYFARPEHVSDQIKTDAVGMTVVPMDIKEGMGVGTTFRIIGDFSGKRLEWDCETIEFVRNEKISAKQIEGPFEFIGNLPVFKLKVHLNTGKLPMNSKHLVIILPEFL